MHQTVCEAWLAWAWDHRFQITAVAVAKAHLGFWLAYLCLYGVPEYLFVSDIIWTYEAYRDALTACTVCEFLIILCYAVRMARVNSLDGVLVGVTALTGMSGWCLLAYTEDMFKHFLGVGIFVGGSAITWFLVLYCTKPHHGNYHGYDYAVYACIILAFVFTASFLVTYEDGDLPGCWLVEQLGLGFYILGFMVFFAFHSFDPRKSLADDAKYQPVAHPVIHVRIGTV